jgi:hypothetical protein
MFAPPRPEHHAAEAHAVEEIVHARDVQVVEGVVALLALADTPLLDGGRYFLHLVPVRDHADQ